MLYDFPFIVLIITLWFVNASYAKTGVTGDENTDETKSSITNKPNLLFIVLDQQRWDAMGIIQQMLPDYVDKVTISKF